MKKECFIFCTHTVNKHTYIFVGDKSRPSLTKYNFFSVAYFLRIHTEIQIFYLPARKTPSKYLRLSYCCTYRSQNLYLFATHAMFAKKYISKNKQVCKPSTKIFSSSPKNFPCMTHTHMNGWIKKMMWVT